MENWLCRRCRLYDVVSLLLINKWLVVPLDIQNNAKPNTPEKFYSGFLLTIEYYQYIPELKSFNMRTPCLQLHADYKLQRYVG